MCHPLVRAGRHPDCAGLACACDGRLPQMVLLTVRTSCWYRIQFASGREAMEAVQMDTPGLRLFSEAELSVLDRMPFDPASRGGFDILAGALVWGDEVPEFGVRLESGTCIDGSIFTCIPGIDHS